MERRGRCLFFFLTIYALLSCCIASSNNNIIEEVIVEVDEFVYSKRGDGVYSIADAANCGSHTAVDGSKFDLSSLTTANGYTNTTASGTYYWNFCVPVTTGLPVMCSTVTPAYAYVLAGSGTGQKCIDIGDTSTPPTLLDGVNGPGSGVQIVYKSSGTGYSTYLRVNCNAQIGSQVAFRSAQPNASEPNVYIITVQAKNGCKLKTGSNAGGLSGGSIFLIVFFVGMATYFLLGSLIKWKLMGAPAGVDMIPNIEFWTQLPGLILDGCRFTKGKIMGLFGGGYNSI